MNDVEYDYIKDQAEREAKAILGELLERRDIDDLDVLFDIHDPVFAVVLDTVDNNIPDNDIAAADISDICYDASDAVFRDYRWETF